MNELPRTLLEAVRYFSSPKVCFEVMLAVKWPDGKITCPNPKTVHDLALMSLLDSYPKKTGGRF